MLYPVTVIPIRDLDLNVCDQILRDIGIGEQSNLVECLDGRFGCGPHPSVSRSAHILRNSEGSSMSCGTRQPLKSCFVWRGSPTSCNEAFKFDNVILNLIHGRHHSISTSTFILLFTCLLSIPVGCES